MSFNIVFSPLSAFRRVGSSRVLHKETNVDTEIVFCFLQTWPDSQGVKEEWEREEKKPA